MAPPSSDDLFGPTQENDPFGYRVPLNKTIMGHIPVHPPHAANRHDARRRRSRLDRAGVTVVAPA